MFGLFSKTKRRQGFVQLDDSKYQSPSKIKEKKQRKIKSFMKFSQESKPGVWSKFYPKDETPLNRTEAFHVNSEGHCGIFVGYGIYNNSHYLNDLWFYNIKSNVWREIPLTGEILSNRAGVSATIVNDYLICFGGYCNGEYYDDLHTINVKTGEVRRIETTGDAPSKRKNPVIGAYQNKLFIWGGYDGSFHNELHILNMDTRVWTMKEIPAKGRFGSATFVSKSEAIIIYGGSKSDKIIVLDMKKEKVFGFSAKGKGPMPTITNATFIRSGDYAYFIGGKTYTTPEPPMEVHALRLKGGFEWFKVKTIPDCFTIDKADGMIIKYSENEMSYGLLRAYDPVGFVNPANNSICITMGSKDTKKPCIFSLDLSNYTFPVPEPQPSRGKENENPSNLVEFQK